MENNFKLIFWKWSHLTSCKQMADNSLFPLIQMENSRKVTIKRVVCWADKSFNTNQLTSRSINIYLSCLHRKFYELAEEQEALSPISPPQQGLWGAPGWVFSMAQRLQHTLLTLCRAPVQATHEQLSANEAQGRFRGYSRCSVWFKAQLSSPGQVWGTRVSNTPCKAGAALEAAD